MYKIPNTNLMLTDTEIQAVIDFANKKGLFFDLLEEKKQEKEKETQYPQNHIYVDSREIEF